VNKIKVLVVDDSSVIRSILKELLSNQIDIEVVGEAEDPFVAREQIKRLQPDVLTLDVEMPKMNGITFLANLMRLRPMPVVMLSTLTSKGAEITLEALELGAVDFIAKPSVETLLASKDSFKTQLLEKIRSAAPINQTNFAIGSKLKNGLNPSPLNFSGVRNNDHLIAIGASTGGTEAIKQVLLSLPVNSPPIVIALHIPSLFSARFAERLNTICQVTVQEAQHGQKLMTGNVYIAQGDHHLKIKQTGTSYFCQLDNSAEVNRHKPSVDVLFESLVPFAQNVQAALLTGMGEDGAKGLLALKENGARTIVQDKDSSLIWGMPGRAHAINAHTHVYSLEKIAKQLLKYALLTRKEMNLAIKEAS
jgi:two-component system chemotaxis response regulator CheB